MYRDAKAQGDLLKTLLTERTGAQASEIAAVPTPVGVTDTPTPPAVLRREPLMAGSGAAELQMVKTWRRRARVVAISFAVTAGLSAVLAGLGLMVYLTPADTEQLA